VLHGPLIHKFHEFGAFWQAQKVTAGEFRFHVKDYTTFGGRCQVWKDSIALTRVLLAIRRLLRVVILLVQP
jgi:hypothetical protein